MSLLSKVSNGVMRRPHYILGHGVPGVGKTSFAAKAPKPLFLCAEKGTRHLDVNRLEFSEFQQFLDVIKELRETKHDYESVVIDTVDHVEPLIHRIVCADHQKTSIEEIGYAKGYIYALDYWRKFVEGIEALRDEKGMNIILLAHTEVKPHNDPQLDEPYDTYKVKLHHKAASLLIDRVECVLFFNYFTHLETEKGKKTKAYGDGSRVMFTEHRPAFQAKNRFELPFKLPLDWDDFDKACKTQRTKSADDLKISIQGMLAEVKDAQIKEKVQAKLKEAVDDAKVLAAIENRLKTIIST